MAAKFLSMFRDLQDFFSELVMWGSGGIAPPTLSVCTRLGLLVASRLGHSTSGKEDTSWVRSTRVRLNALEKR